MKKKTNKISQKQIMELQNHMNNSQDDMEKGAFRAKTLYKVGQRVHLKGTKVNGVITKVDLREDRKFPYISVKWDSEVPTEKQKNEYDPYDISAERVAESKPTKREHHERFNYLTDKID